MSQHITFVRKYYRAIRKQYQQSFPDGLNFTATLGLNCTFRNCVTHISLSSFDRAYLHLGGPFRRKLGCTYVIHF